MFCRSLVFLPLLAFVPSVQAREQVQSHSESHAESRSQPQGESNRQAPEAASTGRASQSADPLLLEQNRKQKRRNELREAFMAPVEEVSVPARQLSPQERAELRHQLRQQPLNLQK